PRIKSGTQLPSPTRLRQGSGGRGCAHSAAVGSEGGKGRGQICFDHLYRISQLSTFPLRERSKIAAHDFRVRGTENRHHPLDGRRKSSGRSRSKAREVTSLAAAAIAGAIMRSRSKRGTRARRLACAVSRAAEDLSGRRNSIPSAAASSSTARMLAVLAFIAMS